MRRAMMQEKDKLKDTDDESKSKPAHGGTSTVAISIFNLSKTIVGNGVLSLPSAIGVFSDSKVAVVYASVILVCLASVAAYSFLSIGHAAANNDATTFASTWNKCSNKISSKTIAGIVTANTYFSCLASSIIIGDSGSNLFRYYGVNSLADRKFVIICATCTIIFPLSMLRKLDGLKYTSLLGILGTVYCAGFMTIRYMDGSYSQGGVYYKEIASHLQPSFGNRFNFNHDVFRLIATGSSAFQAHYNAPKMWAELQHPTLQRYNSVVNTSFLFAAVISVYIMVIGYLTFGGNSAGLILNNYSVEDPFAAFARVSVCLGIVFGYPLSFTAFREGIWDLMGSSTNEAKEKYFLVTTVSLLVLLASCACVVENLGIVISLSGALFGTMLIYIFPAMMNISLIDKIKAKKINENSIQNGGSGACGPTSHTGIGVQYGLMLAGICIAIIGTYLNVVKLIA